MMISIPFLCEKFLMESFDTTIGILLEIVLAIMGGMILLFPVQIQDFNNNARVATILILSSFTDFFSSFFVKTMPV